MILGAPQQVLIPNGLSSTSEAFCTFCSSRIYQNHQQIDCVTEAWGDGAPGALGHAPERAMAPGPDAPHPQGAALDLTDMDEFDNQQT